MFAMDGPIANIPTPLGVCDAIQCPACRPPGTPPVPARNEVEFAVWMLIQHMTTSQHATNAVTVRLITRPARALPRPSHWASCGLDISPAARMAQGAAIGSRYWNPLTG